MAARNLPGPYRIRDLRVKNFTVATNKPPMGPYRGVARPGACFAIERMVDEVARVLGRDPMDLRRQNIVTAAELPYETAGSMTLDTGDYVACLGALERLVDVPAVRSRQAAGEMDGCRIGLGLPSTPNKAAMVRPSGPGGGRVWSPVMRLRRPA